MSFGIYRVVGARAYRGHRTGTEFVAKLDPLAERRAVQRGDIQVVDRLVPTLPPEFSLPRGWVERTTREE